MQVDYKGNCDARIIQMHVCIHVYNKKINLKWSCTLRALVFYILTPNTTIGTDPPSLIYMGKDKYESIPFYFF